MKKYKLTEGALTRMFLLGESELPYWILKSLRTLKNQEFINKVEFLNSLKQKVGENLKDKYEQLILKHADRSNQKVIFLNTLLREISLDNPMPNFNLNRRFGKVEKFILTYSLKYLTNMKGFGGGTSMSLGNNYDQDYDLKEWLESRILLRRNMILKYYQFSSGNKYSNYKKNLKKYIPRKEYYSKQPTITRSINSLAKKEMIKICSNSNTSNSYYGTHARKAFTLTYLGLLKAIDLLTKIYEKGGDSIR